MNIDYYKIDNSIERIKRGECTLFLDSRELKLVKAALTQYQYHIYYLYSDCEKVILYTNVVPDICLFKVNSSYKIRHQDILGSLFSLNIDSSYFGDIVKYQDSYYLSVFSAVGQFVQDHLICCGKHKVGLEKVETGLLSNFQRQYREIRLNVSSLRIDNVIGSLTFSSRNEALKKIKNKEILVNCDILSKNSYLLKENDIFSIKGYGKYKYVGIIKNTRKNRFLITVMQYL